MGWWGIDKARGFYIHRERASRNEVARIRRIAIGSRPLKIYCYEN